MTPNGAVIEVAAGVIFRGEQLLITKRHDDAHLGGLWEFPGGKREPDESFETCLIRELREELGIEVAVGELVESLTQDYAEKRVHLRFFRCEWKQNEPQTLGCAEWRWVRPQELNQYEFPAADARLLRMLQGLPA
jgi:mutator protein MutT